MNLENNNFSKKIEISTQTNIFCSGAFVVEFIQTDLEEGYALAESDNAEILEHLEFSTNDNDLYIKNIGQVAIISNNQVRNISSIDTIYVNGVLTSNSTTLYGTLKVYIRLPKINYIKVSGACSFSCDDIQVDHLKIRVSEAGSVNLSGNAKKIDVKLSGAGKIRINDLVSEDATLEVSGAGAITANVIKSITADVSGVGKIKVYGNPISRKLSKSGLGEIKFE